MGTCCLPYLCPASQFVFYGRGFCDHLCVESFLCGFWPLPKVPDYKATISYAEAARREHMAASLVRGRRCASVRVLCFFVVVWVFIVLIAGSKILRGWSWGGGEGLWGCSQEIQEVAVLILCTAVVLCLELSMSNPAPTHSTFLLRGVLGGLGEGETGLPEFVGYCSRASALNPPRRWDQTLAHFLGVQVVMVLAFALLRPGHAHAVLAPHFFLFWVRSGSTIRAI